MADNGLSGDTFPHFATTAIHVGQDPDQWATKDVAPPISLSTTYKQEAPGKHGGYEYSRYANPTRTITEENLAALEDGKYGLVFPSGLGATGAVCHLLQTGDHIVSTNDLYGGTNRYFQKVAPRNGIETTFVDCTVLDNVRKAIKPNTKMIWIETPTNPMMMIVDIEGVCKIAHEREDIFVVIDNTFASPYFQRPLDFGADIVMHSITKYINGHTDVTMGVLITNRDDLYPGIRFAQYASGICSSPFDCYLANRGIKTLHLRMREHQKNAFEVAKFLEKNPRVSKVLYPGLPSHPQHELAKKQMKGYSGMISCYINGTTEQTCDFLSKLKLFVLAASLGGYESLADHPAIITHGCLTDEEREALGMTGNLVRLSVGLECVEDIIEDLDQALKAGVPLK